MRNKTIPKLLPDLPCIYFNLDRNECVKEIRKPNEFIEDTDYDYETCCWVSFDEETGLWADFDDEEGGKR